MADHNVIAEANRTVIESMDAAHMGGHLVSLGSIVGVFAGLLPVLAAFGAVIWYAIAIWETSTVQSWRKRRRATKGEPHDPTNPIA